MTVAEVEKRVRMIAAVADDYEKAHSLQDALYEDLLRWIAETYYDLLPGLLAESALRAKEINFPRYAA